MPEVRSLSDNMTKSRLPPESPHERKALYDAAWAGDKAEAERLLTRSAAETGQTAETG